MKASKLLLSLLLILSSWSMAHAQVNSEKYQGLLLVGEFGEICTMCEAVLLCEQSATALDYESIPTQGSFTLYHLQTRTFWSQIATIWEWFIANFDSESLAQGHTRPVHVYTITSSRWEPPLVIDAHIALEPPLLSFGGQTVDRRNQAWLSENRPMGYCRRMPLWESLDVIASHAGETSVP